ncbi:MAG: 2,3-diphosphoglycerate synthetase, partial [Actinomycetota bacterium]
MRLLALIDGEHYPPAVRAALQELSGSGDQVVAAVFCGGTEKIPSEGTLDDAYGVPVTKPDDLLSALAEAIADTSPDLVIDLTDEPILSPPERFRLAAVALASGVPYRGADFELRPPVFSD